MELQELYQMKLEELYQELEQVKNSEGEFLPDYGYSLKAEIMELIEEEINEVIEEKNNSTYDYTEEELEAERQYLCYSQGISRW